MVNEKAIGMAVLFLFSLSGFFLVAQNHVLAEMSDIHNHERHAAHMQHMHTMSEEEVIVDLKTEPASITAGSPTTVLLSIKDREGKPIEDLSLHHDRILHVVIASQDFSVFDHIHPEDVGPLTPEMKKTARYPVQFTFPKAGRYLIGVDFAEGEHLFSKHFSVDVAGEPKMGSLKKDFSREKRFGDYDVTFAAIPKAIAAGKEVTLSYLFKKNGEPVTDLEPYLSAPMHVAIVSGDLNHFIHTHGEVFGMSAMGHHEHHVEMEMTVLSKFGPKIEVHATFPVKGLYQIFGQVEHQGKVILTNFMVKVE